MLIRGTAAPIRVGGQIVGAVAINSDMTARAQLEEQRYALARAEARLREREQEFRALVEGVRDYAIFTIGLDGLISSWHVGAQLMKGYTAEEAIGMPFANLFLPEERDAGRPRMEMDVAARTGEYKGEGRRLRKSGETFEAAVVLTALRGPDESLVGYLKLTQDITQRKRADAEREDMLRQAEAARADAERASRAKDDFLATISTSCAHRSGRSSAGHTCSSAAAPAPTSCRSAVEAIRRNAQVQVRLIEDLLDTSRIERQHAARDAAGGPRRRGVRRGRCGAAVAGANGIALDAMLEHGHNFVMGDAGRLQQIVQEPAEQWAQVHARRRQGDRRRRSDADKVELRVADDGQGMEPAFLERAFDRFQQHDASSTRRHGGLGLGLAIVRQLVELHGGRVWAESPGPGRGSTFTVALPALAPHSNADAATAGAMRPSARSTMRNSASSGFTLLLIDDDADGRSVAGFTLGRAGAPARGRQRRPRGSCCGASSGRRRSCATSACRSTTATSSSSQVREAERAEGRQHAGGGADGLRRRAGPRACVGRRLRRHLVKPLSPDALVQAVVDLLRRTLGRGQHPQLRAWVAPRRSPSASKP